MKFKINKILLTIIFVFFVFIGHSQDDKEPPEPGPPSGPPGLPIDGGLTYLIIAGAAFGTYKIQKKD